MGNISDINPSKNIHHLNKKSVDPKQHQKDLVDQKSTKSNEDSASISSTETSKIDHKNDLQKVGDWTDQLMEMEDIRPEKVKQAKERLASGHYNNPKVMEEFFDNLESELKS